MSTVGNLELRLSCPEDLDAIVRIWMQRLPTGAEPTPREIELLRSRLATAGRMSCTWVALGGE